MDHNSFQIWSYRTPGICGLLLRDLWKVINNSNPLVENFILLSRDQKIIGEYKQKNIEKQRAAASEPNDISSWRNMLNYDANKDIP